jgi:hypothetical protein
MTVQPTAQAAGGISPHDTLPCATKGASCLPPTIHCSLWVDRPVADPALFDVSTIVDVRCSSPIPHISLHGYLLRAGSDVAGCSDPTSDDVEASCEAGTACALGTYTAIGDALLTLPDGYVVTQGSNPLHLESAPVQVIPFDCVPDGGGGGGGGGCATATPSSSAQPGELRPHVQVCQ